MLVALRRKHGGALRADFQRYYQLNFDRLGLDFGVAWAADLAAYLPPESATMRVLGDGWSRSERLIAALIDDFRFYVWAKSGGKKAHKPKSVVPASTRSSKPRMKGAVLLPVDEVKRKLAMPRKPVTAPGE